MAEEPYKTIKIQERIAEEWQAGGLAGDTMYGEFAELVALEYAAEKVKEERTRLLSVFHDVIVKKKMLSLEEFEKLVLTPKPSNE